MLKIIEGKRYNTETAAEIAKWSNGYGSSDFKYCWERLYRTPKGAWFLYGEGGAMSKYAEPCGNNGRCGGSNVTVLSPDEAQAWLEAHDEAEALEAHFADRLEDA
jgi:hypothetical protein